jgi:Tol biopolymer transport system component
MLRLLKLICVVYGVGLITLSTLLLKQEQHEDIVSWILYETYVVQDYKYLYRVRWDGKYNQEITSNPAIQAKTVSPDGQWIIFGGRIDQGDYEIYRISPDGLDLKNLTKSLGLDVFPQITSDGKWIVFLSNRDENLGIYRMRIDGSGWQKLADNVSDRYEFDISPDNQWLVYTGKTDSGEVIYRVQIDGSNQQALTQPEDRAYQPQITPDGEAIIYSSATGGNKGKVYTISKESGIPRYISDYERYRNTRITPDNKWILVRSELDNKFQLNRLNFTTLEVQTLQSDIGRLSLLGITPNSRWIILSILQNYRSMTYRMDLDGNSFEAISEYDLNIRAFTSDSQWIIYSDFPTSTIYRIRIDGTEQTKLANYSSQQLCCVSLITLPNMPSHRELWFGIGLTLLCGVLFPKRRLQRILVACFQTGGD